MEEKKPEPELSKEKRDERDKLFRQLDENVAIAREHGGAPAFRVLPDDDRVLSTVVRIGQGEDAPHVLTIDIEGADGIAPDVRILILRKHFESMLEDYLDT